MPTFEMDVDHGNFVPCHDDGPDANVGRDSLLDLDSAVSKRGRVEPVLPLSHWAVARSS